MPVPVWGWSTPGTKMTVQFAGQKKSETAGKDGKWMLKLDALKANANPQEMVITDSAGKKITLENILVGEVWATAGQSNMQWIAQKSSSSLIIKELIEQAKAEKGKLPPIREGKVTNVFSSLHPIEHAEGAWSDGSSFSGYSAIAFAFAHELYKELKIPIGILNCAFSTTTIQAWIPRVGIASGTDDYTRGLHKRVLEGDFRAPEHKAAWDHYYQEQKGTAVGKSPGFPRKSARQSRHLLDVQRQNESGDPLCRSWRDLGPGLCQHERRQGLLPQPAFPDTGLAEIADLTSLRSQPQTLK